MNYFISNTEFKALVPRLIPPFSIGGSGIDVVGKVPVLVVSMPLAEKQTVILKSAAAKIFGRSAPKFVHAPASFSVMPPAGELALLIKVSAVKMFGRGGLKPRANPVIQATVSVLSQQSIESWALELKSLMAPPLADRPAGVAHEVLPSSVLLRAPSRGAIATNPILRKRLTWAELNALPPDQQLGHRMFQYTLRQYAQNLTHNQDTALDLCSSATVRALTALKRGLYVQQPNVPFKAYVFMILRNEFYTGMRKKRWHADVEDFDTFAAQNMTILPTQESQSLLIDPVLVAMKKLVPQYREALLAIVHGQSYDQAATELGVPVGTIKSRVGRARDQLQKLLDSPMPK